MKNKWLILMMSIMTAGLGLLMFQGCEDEKDSDLDEFSNDYQSESRDTYDSGADSSELVLTPASKNATRAGEQFTFTVKGGQSPFTWSVADSSAGTVSVNENTHYATYTVKAIAENEIVVQDNKGIRASAAINRSYSTLSISPANTSIAKDGSDNVSFTASGGLGPYTWYSFNAAFGSFPVNTGTTAAYSDLAKTGTNTITVIDANGDKAETQVYHIL